MRYMIIAAVLLANTQAFAAVGDIRCVAKQFTVTEDGLTDKIEKELTVTRKEGSALNMEVEIGPRAFVLAGDTASGDFLLTQAWGQDYTTGINTSGSFNSSGRMTISLVEVTKVFKLECSKTLASDFPRE